jgi:hypothetical protein
VYADIYDVFYSQYSHQLVSSAILAICRLMLLLQEYNRDKLRHHYFMVIKIM